MNRLDLCGKYSGRVHDYFVPGGTFTPNAGTWGLHGCVLIPNTSMTMSFVTYGQSQGDHMFKREYQTLALSLGSLNPGST